MICLLLASAVAAADPPPEAGPPSTPPPAASVPTATPASPPPSIDSLLKPGPDQTTDAAEEPGAAVPPAPPQGPVPYSQLDGKAYEDAIRNSAAEGRSMAGALDGGWTLAGTDGQRLYRFQFVGHGGLEQADGAWRDLNGGARLAGSGVIDQVAFAGDQLTLRFYETGPADEVVVTVKPAGTAPWTGELRRHGADVPVTFKKD